MFLKERYQMTPYLIFCCLVYMQGALLFGIDTGSFGSLQALPSFVNRFGTLNGSGKYILETSHKSMMNSLPWIGKLTGCLSAEPVIERLGYKKAMYISAAIQLIAVTIELTAHHWAQFTVGRIIAYYAVGIVENAVPSYIAEVSPAATRGLLSGSLIMVTGLGNLWGAGMSRAYATDVKQHGWIIPTSMQFIPAVGLLLLMPFTPDSPRWLLLKGRKEAAQLALEKLRNTHDVQNGVTQAEINSLELLAQQSLEKDRSSWRDLFRGNYLRRTWICSTLFVLEQANGNQFIQSYGATFYVQQGLGSKSFTYTTIGQVIGVIGSTIGIVLFDISGRRFPMIGGSCICCLLLFVAAGLGRSEVITTNERNTMLACFMLLPAFTRISASNTAFLTGAEIGGTLMRKKTMAFGTACDVAAAFLITFVTPYLLPHMNANIGWIFGSVAAFGAVWSIFFFPELKGRSLEEVDQLFEARLHAWEFKHFQTQDAHHLLANKEKSGIDSEKLPIAEAREVQSI